MYIGIDVGGMSIKAGLVDHGGKLLCKHSVPTPKGGNDEFCAALRSAVDGVIEKADFKGEIDAIGMGAPGIVNREDCRLVYSCNIAYDNAPVGEYLKKIYNAPVLVENDANCAAVGEFYAAPDVRNFVFITLGTGVGGGVIINGKLFIGSNGAGAELGHIVTHAGGVKCGCGRLGCWEAYASVTALINQTKVAIEKHPESLMKSLAEENGHVSGRTAFDAAKKGDPAAKEVVDKYIEYVADGLVSIVNIFQPDKIVVSGGISKEGDYLLDPVREYVKKYDYNKLFKRTEIETATLYNDAGIIGAAFAAKNFR